MKENWTYKPFMECIEKVKYTTKIQSRDFAKVGKYPIISQEDTYLSGYWDNESDVFKVPRPVVIFGDHTRVLKYIDFDFVLGADGVKILLPIKDIVAKFMYYYIQWYKIPNLGYSRHFKLFQDIKFPMAPISAQQSIVQELDTINDVLSKKREQLKELDKLAQSIFYDMFGDPVTNEKGWEKVQLSDVCDVRDGTHDSPQYLQSSKYVLITSKNIKDDTIDFTTSVNYISEDDYIAINKRSKVDIGDILMPMIGTIGNPIIVAPTDQQYCVKNVALIKFAESTKVINVYIKRLLDNPSYMSYLIGLNKGGTQKFVALGTIRKLSIPLPPLPLQQAFAEKIEKIEQMKENLKASIHETETLLASRMSYWFE